MSEVWEPIFPPLARGWTVTGGSWAAVLAWPCLMTTGKSKCVGRDGIKLSYRLWDTPAEHHSSTEGHRGAQRGTG